MHLNVIAPIVFFAINCWVCVGWALYSTRTDAYRERTQMLRETRND